jgi:uncharacterized phage-associated protein
MKMKEKNRREGPAMKRADNLFFQFFNPEYNELKTTEAASILLQLHGGRMEYLMLLKLLYLADREALLKWERPITYDNYSSMDKGPVLSNTYNIIKAVLPDRREIWNKYISVARRYCVHLIDEAPKIKKLSQAEIDLLNNIYDRYGKMNRWDLVKYTHTLPEYKDPHGSSIPIKFNDLLGVLGYGKEDIERITAEMQAEAEIDSILGA